MNLVAKSPSRKETISWADASISQRYLTEAPALNDLVGTPTALAAAWQEVLNKDGGTYCTNDWVVVVES